MILKKCQRLSVKHKEQNYCGCLVKKLIVFHEENDFEDAMIT